MIAAQIPSSAFASEGKDSPWNLAKPVTVCEPACPASNSCNQQSREHCGAPVSYGCDFSSSSTKRSCWIAGPAVQPSTGKLIDSHASPRTWRNYTVNRTRVSLLVFVGKQKVIPSFPAAYPSRLLGQYSKRTECPQKMCYAPSLACNHARGLMFIDSSEI